MTHGSSFCDPYFEKTSLRDTARPLSCNGVFSKWGSHNEPPCGVDLTTEACPYRYESCKRNTTKLSTISAKYERNHEEILQFHRQEQGAAKLERHKKLE